MLVQISVEPSHLGSLSVISWERHTHADRDVEDLVKAKKPHICDVSSNSGTNERPLDKEPKSWFCQNKSLDMSLTLSG